MTLRARGGIIFILNEEYGFLKCHRSNRQSGCKLHMSENVNNTLESNITPNNGDTTWLCILYFKL